MSLKKILSYLNYFFNLTPKKVRNMEANSIIDDHFLRIERYLDMINELHPAHQSGFSESVGEDFQDYVWNRYKDQEFVKKYADSEKINILEVRVKLLRNRYYAKIEPRRGLKAV